MAQALGWGPRELSGKRGTNRSNTRHPISSKWEGSIDVAVEDSQVGFENAMGRAQVSKWDWEGERAIPASQSQGSTQPGSKDPISSPLVLAVPRHGSA